MYSCGRSTSISGTSLTVGTLPTTKSGLPSEVTALAGDRATP
jgi:hypothetical protein